MLFIESNVYLLGCNKATKLFLWWVWQPFSKPCQDQFHFWDLVKRPLSISVSVLPSTAKEVLQLHLFTATTRPEKPSLYLFIYKYISVWIMFQTSQTERVQTPRFASITASRVVQEFKHFRDNTDYRNILEKCNSKLTDTET